MIKITVITICFNNKQDLIETCLSIDNQTTQPYQHIIIDGSTNNEIKNYLQNSECPIYRKWISEKDEGIADAFNKGLQFTDGDFIQYLNSGDSYYDNNVLNIVVDSISTNIDANWFHGKLKLQRAGVWVEIGKPFDPSKIYRGMRSTFHPTMFVKRELFKKYGGFDTKLKIAMDYDFLLRIKNESFFFIEYPLVTFNPDGVSNTNYLNSLLESKDCYKKYYGESFKLTLWQLRLKFLYFILQFPIGKWIYNLKKKLGLENI